MRCYKRCVFGHIVVTRMGICHPGKASRKKDWICMECSVSVFLKCQRMPGSLGDLIP